MMFVVIACMLAGMAGGYLFRSRKIQFTHRFILGLIWLLLFLLGLELGGDKIVVRQFGTLGFEALLLAFGGTLGSVLAAWLLWTFCLKKGASK